MNYFLKGFCLLILSPIILSCMFSCKARYAYNPYLHAKNKPSDIQRKGEQKQIKIGTKAYAEQMKKNKKDIQGNIQKATDPQKKYKKITKRKRNKKSKDHTWHL